MWILDTNLYAVADNAVSEPPCCEVCLVSPCESFALVPCGHTRFCERCAHRVADMRSGCTVCRTDITMVMRCSFRVVTSRNISVWFSLFIVFTDHCISSTKHCAWWKTLHLRSLCFIYTVSQKNCAKLFCQNFVKFSPILIIFDRKMAKKLKWCEMHSFSASSNSCQCHHTTVLNTDVPNCYTTLLLLVLDCSNLHHQFYVIW